MKGFLGALCVFFLWSALCIYYMINSQHKREVSRLQEATSQISPRLKQFNSQNEASSENGLAQTDNSSLDGSTFSGDRSKINTISRSESKLIADELMKSFTISDTLDVAKDEPKLTLETTPNILRDPNVVGDTFYPRYEGSSLVVDRDLIKHATDLKEVLDQNPSKKLLIIGHTDNIGDKNDNFSIGLKKARQIKWYLTTRIGISREKIRAISRGEEDPIESNSSAYGQNKNNRVEIIVE